MPDSLKNMVSSVDWSKLMSSQDAKNALIGSALGGLMMGGASALSDRDPEESKYAPVGDALVGALLGGAAGYGIPKGLALFRDAGGLAPDNDRISGGAGGAALTGLGVGTAAAGGIIAPTAWRAFGRMRNNAKLTHAENAAAARSAATAKPTIRAALKDIAYNGKGPFSGGAEVTYDTVVKELKRLAKGKNVQGDQAKRYLKYILNERSKAQNGMQRGVRGVKDLVREMWGEAPVDVSAGKGERVRRWIANLTNGGTHYQQKPVGSLMAPFFPGKITPAGARILGRAGKYGLAGAGIGYALNKLFGPSARNNFKN